MKDRYVKDLVSVIIPTYRRSEKLPRAIKSVLNQTYKDIELLVVNDNDPNDEHTQYVRGVANAFSEDKRFRLIIQEKHVNGAVARNIAIRQAKGEFVAFLDDDDWWEPEKITAQISELKSLDESWGGVSCKFTLYNQEGQVIGRTNKYDDGYIFKDVLSLYSDVATGTLLLRRKALDDSGYFDENLIRNQDIQLLSQFTYRYKLKEVDQYLHCVDVSDSQNRAVDESKLLKIRKDLYKSVDNILSTLSKSDMAMINAMRDLEVAYILIQNKKYKASFKYIMPIFYSVKSLMMAIKMMRRKINVKRNCN